MARKPRHAFPMPGADGSQPPSPARPVPQPARQPMFARGAASLENAKKSAAAEDRMYRLIPVEMIDPSPIRDRIDLSEDLEMLKDSLRDEGQQIPILVRPKPDSDRFEIVAGRRRLQATRELGEPTIQAFVRRMTDEEAFVAQGVENNARLETSFIERARTILSALEAGFTQVQVEKFLGVDQTMISRMKTIYTGLGEDIVLAIGPARGVGRRKWERLQKLVADSGEDLKALLRRIPREAEDSVARFDGMLSAMERSATPAPAQPKPAPRSAATPPAQTVADGALSVSRKARQMVLKTSQDLPEGFLDYLEEQLPDLVRTYRQKSVAAE